MSQPPAGSSTFVPYTTKFAYANKSTQYGKPFYAKVIEQKNTENQAKFDTWKALPDGDVKYQQGVELGYINKVDYDNYVTQKTAIDTWNALPNNESKYQKGVEAGYIDKADYDSYIAKKTEIDNWNSMPDGLDKAKAGLAKGYVSVEDYNSYTSAIEQNKAKLNEYNTWKTQPVTTSSIEEGFNKGFYDLNTRNEYLNNLQEFEAWKASPDSWEKSRIAIDKGYMTFPEAGEYYNTVLYNQQVDKFNSLKDDPVAQLTYGVNIGLITNEQYKTDLARVENSITYNKLPANNESQIIAKLRYARDNGIEVTLSSGKILSTREQFAEAINSVSTTEKFPSPVEWVVNPLDAELEKTRRFDLTDAGIRQLDRKSDTYLSTKSVSPDINGVFVIPKVSTELSEAMSQGLVKMVGGTVKRGSILSERQYVITKSAVTLAESKLLASAGFNVTEIPIISEAKGASGWSKQIYESGESGSINHDFAIGLAVNASVILDPLQDAIDYGKSLIFKEEYIPTQKINADNIIEYEKLNKAQLDYLRTSADITSLIASSIVYTEALSVLKTGAEVVKITGGVIKATGPVAAVLSKIGAVANILGKPFSPLASGTAKIIAKPVVQTALSVSARIAKEGIRAFPYALSGATKGIKVAEMQLAGASTEDIARAITKDIAFDVIVFKAFANSKSYITKGKNFEVSKIEGIPDEFGNFKAYKLSAKGSLVDIGGKQYASTPPILGKKIDFVKMTKTYLGTVDRAITQPLLGVSGSIPTDYANTMNQGMTTELALINPNTIIGSSKPAEIIKNFGLGGYESFALDQVRKTKPIFNKDGTITSFTVDGKKYNIPDVAKFFDPLISPEAKAVGWTPTELGVPDIKYGKAEISIKPATIKLPVLSKIQLRDLDKMETAYKDIRGVTAIIKKIRTRDFLTGVELGKLENLPLYTKSSLPKHIEKMNKISMPVGQTEFLNPYLDSKGKPFVENTYTRDLYNKLNITKSKNTEFINELLGIDEEFPIDVAWSVADKTASEIANTINLKAERGLKRDIEKYKELKFRVKTPDGKMLSLNSTLDKIVNSIPPDKRELAILKELDGYDSSNLKRRVNELLKIQKENSIPEGEPAFSNRGLRPPLPESTGHIDPETGKWIEGETKKLFNKVKLGSKLTYIDTGAEELIAMRKDQIELFNLEEAKKLKPLTKTQIKEIAELRKYAYKDLTKALDKIEKDIPPTAKEEELLLKEKAYQTLKRRVKDLKLRSTAEGEPDIKVKDEFFGVRDGKPGEPIRITEGSLSTQIKQGSKFTYIDTGADELVKLSKSDIANTIAQDIAKEIEAGKIAPPKLNIGQIREIAKFKTAYGKSSLFPEINDIIAKWESGTPLNGRDLQVLADIDHMAINSKALKIKNTLPQFKGSLLESYTKEVTKISTTGIDPKLRDIKSSFVIEGETPDKISVITEAQQAEKIEGLLKYGFDNREAERIARAIANKPVPSILTQVETRDLIKLGEVYGKSSMFPEFGAIKDKLLEGKPLTEKDYEVLREIDANIPIKSDKYPTGLIRIKDTSIGKLIEKTKLPTVPVDEPSRKIIKDMFVTVDDLTGEIRQVSLLDKLQKSEFKFDSKTGKWEEGVNGDLVFKVNKGILEPVPSKGINLDAINENSALDLQHLKTKAISGKFLNADEMAILKEASPLDLDELKDLKEQLSKQIKITANGELQVDVDADAEAKDLAKQLNKITEANKKKKEIVNIKYEDKPLEEGEQLQKDGTIQKVIQLSPEEAAKLREKELLEKGINLDKETELKKAMEAYKVLKAKGISEEEAIRIVSEMNSPTAVSNKKLFEGLTSKQQKTVATVYEMIGKGVSPRLSTAQTSIALRALTNPTVENLNKTIPLMDNNTKSLVLPQFGEEILLNIIKGSDDNKFKFDIFNGIKAKPDIIDKILPKLDDKTISFLLPNMTTDQVNKLSFKQISDTILKLKSFQDTNAIQKVMEKLDGKTKLALLPLLKDLEFSEEKGFKEKPSKKALLYKVMYFYKDKTKTVEKNIYARTFSDALNKTWFDRGSNVIPKRVRVIFLGKEEVKK